MANLIENKADSKVSELFGSSTPELSETFNEKKEMQKRKRSVFTLIAVATTAVFLMLAVHAGVRLNESTVRASGLKNEISILEKQNREYQSALEKKNDMVRFEQYAIEELGMLKGNQVDEEDRQDKIE